MMSSSTTNTRRRAVERAVKQSELVRARQDASLNARMLARGETPLVRPHTFTVAEQAALFSTHGR